MESVILGSRMQLFTFNKPYILHKLLGLALWVELCSLLSAGQCLCGALQPSLSKPSPLEAFSHQPSVAGPGSG